MKQEIFFNETRNLIFSINSKSITNDCFFWNVSYEVLARIEGASYISNKEKHNDYLWFHPYVAKKRFINLYSTGKFD